MQGFSRTYSVLQQKSASRSPHAYDNMKTPLSGPHFSVIRSSIFAVVNVGVSYTGSAGAAGTMPLNTILRGELRQMSVKKIGMVGLGLLGTALAERLLARGYTLVGYDLDAAARDRLKSMGGRAVRSAREVAIECTRIVLSLPNADVGEKVIQEMLPVASSATIIIDTTTGMPTKMAKLAETVSAQNIGYLDATVGGSSEQARKGEVIVIAGGDEKSFEKCEKIFACFAKHAFHVGPCGSGAKIKLAVNLVLGLNRAVLAEGLKFAESCGLNTSEVLKVLRASPAYSQVMDTKGSKMLNGEFEPEAKLSQHLKDVRLILNMGTENGAKLHLTKLHKRILKTAEAAGYGDSDNSAVIKAYD